MFGRDARGDRLLAAGVVSRLHAEVLERRFSRLHFQFRVLVLWSS
jgi:hypothetical protein